MASSNMWSAFAIGAVSLALVHAPAIAQSDVSEPQATEVCELHVWAAGKPNRPLPGWLVKSIDPWLLDTENPYSGPNIFGTEARAKALPDGALSGIFGEGVETIIVRHDEVIDLEEVSLNRFKEPMSDSSAVCQADLVLRHVSAVWPNPSTTDVGVVGGLVAGGNRLIMGFWYQEFRADAKRLRVSKKDDSPLEAAPQYSRRMAEVVAVSAEANARNFVEHVQEKRAQRNR